MLRRTPLSRGTKGLKRGKGLARTGGLSRSSKLPRKRSKPRRGRKVDEAHLAFVRTLHCCVCGKAGPSEAHHEKNGHGAGRKADDDRTMPMCWQHHRPEFHEGKGYFEGWTKERRAEWQDAQVRAVLALQQPGAF